MALRTANCPPSHTYEDSSDLEATSSKLKNIKLDQSIIPIRDISNLLDSSFEARQDLRQSKKDKLNEEHNKEKEEKQQPEKKRIRRLFVPNPNSLAKTSTPAIYPTKKKGPAECSDEELIERYCDFIMKPLTREIALKEAPILRKYIMQVEASDGFDIEDWPNPLCLLITAPYPADRSPEDDEYYLMLANFALENYNKNNGTDLRADKIVKVNSGPRSTFFITFEVKDRKAGEATPSQTFQAKVNETYSSICRPKPVVK